jgi:hypothetical protein
MTRSITFSLHACTPLMGGYSPELFRKSATKAPQSKAQIFRPLSPSQTRPQPALRRCSHRCRSAIVRARVPRVGRDGPFVWTGLQIARISSPHGLQLALVALAAT